jgi:hypothetical protein
MTDSPSLAGWTGTRSQASSMRLAALFLALSCTLAARARSQGANPAASQGASLQGASSTDPRWTAIGKVFGWTGEIDDGYFRLSFPRTDLQVRIGNDLLSPRFEFTGYFGFVPIGRGDVMAMGEVILRDDETLNALTEARRQGVRVSALHNHLIGETPRIVYMHVTAEGPAEAVATKLRAVLAKTGVPLAKPADLPPTAEWSAIDAILGKHEEAEGPVAEYEFPRREGLMVGGQAVKSSGVIETGSEVVFQQLAPGRVASTGELYLLPNEVEPVLTALNEHGLPVTALHNHMLDDGPPHFWVHWYATGDGPTLARGIAAALSHMNSAQKSGSKK